MTARTMTGHQQYWLPMQAFLRLCISLGILFVSASSTWAAESEMTRELNGTTITYEYTSGRSYNVRFEEDGVRYQYLTGSKPETWWGPFPYQAIRVKDNLYFASWFEKGYGDYVTLLINFSEKKLHGSAIIRGEEVHFHSAEITQVTKP